MEEVWKDIEGYEGKYKISNFGRIMSFCGNPKILKTSLDKYGYVKIKFNKDGEGHWYFVHRLVAKSFLANPEDKPQINHKDGNKQNNCVSNLEWCTAKENIRHAFENNLNFHSKKASQNSAKSCAKKVLQYDLDGNFIKEWDSMHSIEKELNINFKFISACCRDKQKSAKGYIWKYK